MMHTGIFHKGRAQTPHSKLSLQKVVEEKHILREKIHQYHIEDLIDYIDSYIAYLEKNGFTKKYLYLKNFADFFNKKNLRQTLSLALRGNIKVLDQFCDLGDPHYLFHTQPRGIVIQWLAGNVTVLGLFSIFSALLTKNVSIVKASARGYDDLVMFLDLMRRVSTKKVKGIDLAKTITVVLIDRKDINAHQYLSESAHVRIAWGGKEAIETITQLKKSVYCEDIIFGPKYSYGLIGKNTFTKGKLRKIAQRMAIDVSVFDQYACSSPHTIFVEEQKKGDALIFAKELGTQLELIERTLIPKEQIDSGKAAEIVSLRTEYMIRGKVISSKDTKWTVIYSTDEKLAESCFSRVVYVKPLRSIAALAQLNDRNKQTITSALSTKSKLQLADQLTFRGVDRIPNVGYATYYESPWDGMFVFDRLVRWITVHKQEL